MIQAEFDIFDAAPKIIRGDISFRPKQPNRSFLTSGELLVINQLGLDASLEIIYNPDADSKCFNISIGSAGGAVCRLCVDGKPHRPCGRCHKHKLLTQECPKNNLPIRVQDLPELAGTALEPLFGMFCKMTNIIHEGNFLIP